MEQCQFSVKFKDETFNALYVTDHADAYDILSKLYEKDCLFGIDTETAAHPEYKGRTNAALSPHLSGVRLLQIFDGKNSVIFDTHSILNRTLFTDFLENKRFVAHNAVFDLQFFKREFGVKRMNLGCTMLLSKLLFHAVYPTDEGLSVSLQNMVEKVFKENILKHAAKSDWSEPDLTFEQIEYAALDAICVLKLAEKLAPGLTKFKLERYYQLCKDAQHPIAEMQLNGLKLDVKAHKSLCEKWVKNLYNAKKEVRKLTGLEQLTSHTIAGYLEKNLKPETLRIWPRTEKEKIKTDSHTFSDFAWLPIVKPFEKFQKQLKLSTAFGSKLISQVNPETSRIHPSYKLCGARTGRLSCSSPNLQQMPRDAELRNNFIPESNSVFLCADYSQIELRVAAELSQDKAMLSAYKQGIDLHALTASKIANKPLKDVTKTERQMAKAVNFGLLFGLGSNKFSHYARKSYGVEVTQEEADKSIETFRETYAGYREWQLAQAEKAAMTHLVRTPCGKLRKLPSDNTYGNSMNHPVQGGAAEVMLHALIRLHKALQNWPTARLVNCVHDEILLEVFYPTSKYPKSDNTAFFKNMLEDCMVNAYLDVFPKGITKGLVDIKEGNSWGAAK